MNAKSSNVKDSNPKDAIGSGKWRRFATVPRQVIWRVGVAMLEGALKYGQHNYRAIGIRESVYFDATMGHLEQYWEGEDIDPDSCLHHLDKAIASLVVWRDGILNGKNVDDRPPKVASLDGQRAEMQAQVDALMKKYPEPKKPFTEVEMNLRED